MFFYSIFESHKYPVRDDTSTDQAMRLEFRGFHDPMDIAHYLSSQAPHGHRRHGESPGQIFRDYVDMHMKDVHFFFDLAYKTSGNVAHYAESTRMVRDGASIDAIIEQVRLEESKIGEVEVE